MKKFISEIKNSNFETCWRGVYIASQYNPEIWLNDFEVTPYDNATPGVNNWPVGIYLGDNVKGYIVEENSFFPIENSTELLDGTAIGIVANTDHGETERIYKNSFKHLTVAFESIGENRYDQFQTHNGLRITCNDFEMNRADIYMTQGSFNTDYAGIAFDQGFAPNDLAFNTFTASNFFNIDNEVDYINYRYKAGDPSHFPLQVFDLDVNVNLDAVNPSQIGSCGSNIDLDESNERNTRTAAITNKEEKEYQMAQVLDGGDTQSLQTNVAATSNTTVWTNYLELMSKAGYITEEVLKELINNESGFTKAMTRDVLVANPHAAKSKEISTTLDERADPLPDYMREQIKLGLTQMSAKEFLQAQKDRYKMKEDIATRNIQHLLLREEMNVENQQELVELLSNTGDIENDYKLVELYDAFGQQYLGDALLESMQVMYELKSNDEEELERYISYRQMMDNWQLEGKDFTNLNEPDIVALENYTEVRDRVASEAKGLLIMNDEMVDVAPVYLPDFNKTFNVFKPKMEEFREDNGQLEVFPNPAEDYFTIKYRIDKAFNKGEIRIVDVNGKEVFSRAIFNEEDQVIIDAMRNANFTSGTYICEIRIDGKTYSVENITIK